MVTISVERSARELHQALFCVSNDGRSHFNQIDKRGNFFGGYCNRREPEPILHSYLTDRSVQSVVLILLSNTQAIWFKVIFSQALVVYCDTKPERAFCSCRDAARGWAIFSFVCEACLYSIY